MIVESLLSGGSSLTQIVANFSPHSVLFRLLQFHVTTRLKAHSTQRLLNNFASLNSTKVAPVDKERLKKAPGLPPVHGQSNHSLNNGLETESIHNRQVCNWRTNNYWCVLYFGLLGYFSFTCPHHVSSRSCCWEITVLYVGIQDEKLANIGSPPRELGTQDHNWISRTTSKLRSVKSGFGALNAAHRVDDMSLQVNDVRLDSTMLNWENVGIVLTKSSFNNKNMLEMEISFANWRSSCSSRRMAHNRVYHPRRLFLQI